MHIRINRDVLFKAFFHSQSVIERKTTLLILGHTLIQTSNDSITLISTDMDISLSEMIEAEIIREGSICIPTILAYEILRKLKPNSIVEIVYADNLAQISISSGRSKFEIPCVSAEEFPRILQESDSYDCHFSIPALTFKNMIETVRFAMSSDEMRYALNGIHFSYDVSLKELRAVATDRHRLASVEIEGPEGAEKIPSIIIGRKAITEISKLLEDAVEPVLISVSETRIELVAKFEKSNVKISSRLVDGSFPEYSAVLNIPHDKKIITGTKVFADAIDRVGTVISDKTRVIKIGLSRNLLHCSSIGNISGSASEDIDVDYENGSVMELSFDVKYLLDIAQHISTDDMEISLTNPDTAISIRPVGIKGVYFALMPLAPQTQYTES
jgi:DNA polymerase-3 subunit beta